MVLFGSLAQEAWFGERTDVDLAVQGLPKGTYWTAWRRVEEIVEGRSVDLLEIETIKAPLLQVIEQQGIEL